MSDKFERSVPKNCPACGEVIEVAHPIADAKSTDVKLEKADHSPLLAHKHGQFPCPKCGVKIVAIW
jgi:predicted RNA-binding Zn-ribbon protein involved in translation (DUF1610 family)